MLDKKWTNKKEDEESTVDAQNVKRRHVQQTKKDTEKILNRVEDPRRYQEATEEDQMMSQHDEISQGSKMMILDEKTRPRKPTR